MSLSPDAYASHSSSSSLNFLMFYIESKQEITLIFYLLHIFKEVNKHVLIQVVYDCFQLGLSFLRWVFIGHSKFQIIEIAKLLIWETKFRDENGTFIDVCVLCVYVYLYTPLSNYNELFVPVNKSKLVKESFRNLHNNYTPYHTIFFQLMLS